MKSMFSTFRNVRLATSLALGLSLANSSWSKPSLESIAITPSPLLLGRSFTITATGSPDVTSATASLDFRPGKAQTLDFCLTNIGSSWTASGQVPSDLGIKHPDKARAKLKVVLFDAAGKKADGDLQVEIDAPTISAVFAGGILTVSGDEQDNTLIVSRDTAGSLLVNGGALPITGGVPTVTNTTLIQIFGFGGNDTLTIDDSNGPMPPANLVGGDGDDTLTGSASDDTLDGGPGNDTLIGRGGNDTLLGGPGNDILIGGQGTDQLLGGDGDDQIIWNPGDGSDVVEGGAGNDTLVFNGANIAETVDLSANGPRFRFFRNVANITMDCDGVEQVVFRALGGADQVTVNDLTGTAVTNVLVDLSSSAGTGDGAADTVIVNGTATNDNITVTGSPTNATVLGLSAVVTVVGAEPALDNLTINGLAGEDVIDASAVSAGAISLTLNGGLGNDILIGGDGNDTLIGGQGNDTAFGGAGDDTFIWNPGDGSDTFEGEGGRDTMVFNGANISETVDLSANGRRLRFFRNVANITMDCDGVEVVQFNALGGADTVTVNNLTGTDVTEVDLDLASPPKSGQGDGAADSVIVNATESDDVVTVTGTPAAGVSVQGLSAIVNIVGSEPALDQLIVNLLGGDDAFSGSDLQAGVINLTVNGGTGNDVIIGSHGDDTLSGGEGDDILIGGDGLDVLDGGPGNNVIIQ